ncbi:conserved unknown protein [Ectocarpus siliculosus]|uniref:Plastid lipid-associated protein/fibrillin conserved domain-containing protein n=1 Tax=Ectocarpus siliculosus TaxID=2880 RepID=D7FQD7_ECTSI|nr:conserved unknown protein [Ectocarpus siliculosus]|eukprot:CBJ48469.1 conserved unknown protein [Ectocarpus siliculosus]
MRLLLCFLLARLVSLAAGFGLRPGMGSGRSITAGNRHTRHFSCCDGKHVLTTRMSSVGTPADVDEITLIKNSLLQVAAMTERGQLATEAQQNDMDLLLERLEELKAEELLEPYKDENMVGTWTLVYSSSQAFRSSPFFATFQALIGKDGVAERIFSFTDAFPNAKIGQARQIVNEDCTELLSRVEMSVWPHRWISGVVETRSKIVNDDIGDQLEVIVDDTRVSDSILGKISPRLEEVRVPVDQLSERLFDRIPRITLDTVFLDQDLRVSRLPDRNFLVYVKDY